MVKLEEIMFKLCLGSWKDTFKLTVNKDYTLKSKSNKAVLTLTESQVRCAVVGKW